MGIALVFTSCLDSPFELDEKTDKYLLKFERNKNVSVEMYTYTSAYYSSPTYLVIKKGILNDTICVATNITDFDLNKDTLKVYFFGEPKKYNVPIVISDFTLNEKVIVKVDTINAYY